jgi:hypothetical protein
MPNLKGIITKDFPQGTFPFNVVAWRASRDRAPFDDSAGGPAATRKPPSVGKCLPSCDVRSLIQDTVKYGMSSDEMGMSVLVEEQYATTSNSDPSFHFLLPIAPGLNLLS